MTEFIEAKHFIYRSEGEKIQIRLFEVDYTEPSYGLCKKPDQERIMYVNMGVEEMKALRDFLDRKIEAIEK